MVDLFKIEKKKMLESLVVLNCKTGPPIDESEPETVEQLGLFNLSFFFFLSQVDENSLIKPMKTGI